MDPFALALGALFRAPGSLAIVFIPAGGQPIPTRAIRGDPDAASPFGGGSIVQATNLFQVPASDVLQPHPGDRILVGGEAFVVSGVPTLDVERITWNCMAVPA